MSEKTWSPRLLQLFPKSQHVQQLIDVLDGDSGSSLSSLILLIGLHSAGKSTLAQALTGRLFPSGIGPTTHSLNIVDMGPYRLGDTPGLNAIVSDTRVAEGAMPRADYYLFVHAAILGELRRDEIIRLQVLKQSGFVNADNLLVVVTHRDAREEEWSQIKRKIEDQLQTSLGFLPILSGVASLDYQDAGVNNDEELRESSGIPQLQSLIEERVCRSQESLEKQRRARTLKLQAAVRKELEDRRDAVQSKLDEIKRSDRKRRKAIKADILSMAKSASTLLYN